jgi:predicted DNA-binding ribbon-helix-helix protein
MNWPVVKRSIILAGTRTSIWLEEEFWAGLREIADRRHISLSEIVGEIDRGRQRSNLSSAKRVYVAAVLPHERVSTTARRITIKKPLAFM